MKPQELSIGNIVEVNHYEYGDMFASVTSINDVGDLCLHLLDERFTKEEYECTMNEVTPIPITEELLEKCGFERNNDTPPYILDLDKGRRVYMFKITYGWILQYVRYGVGYDETVSKNIVMFVHQLQNAYYLVTGKELEIKI